jgi:hypothetical protein
MGFSFKKIASIATGGYALGKIGDMISGPKARAMGQFDQRGANEVRWDPQTGMPIGLNGAVDPNNALAFQQRANEVVATRNQGRRNDASAFMEQGLRASETYRPGGYAAMASGIHAQRAQLAFADQIEAPDLLAGYREQKSVDAANQQRRAAKMNFLSGLAQTAGMMIGGPAGGAAVGLAAGAAAGGGGPGATDPYSDGGGADSGADSGMSGGGPGGGFDPYALAQRGESTYGSTEFRDAWSNYNRRRMTSIGGIA